MKAAVFCLLLSLASSTWAVNGFSVVTSFSFSANGMNSLGYGGKVVRYDIQSDAVRSNQTIFDGLAWYPVISFDGTRVAFFRAASTSRWDTGYVSIVNKDGTGLKDLVKLYAGQYGYSCNFGDCQGGFLAWPAGEWVYYEKPPKTGEFWRVNVNDPSLNHLVVRYDCKGKRPTNCACYVSGYGSAEGFWLRRWQLSKDAKYCSGMFKDYPQGQQIPHRFPPPEGYAPFSMAIFGVLPACNLCMSPSGHYMTSFIAACHDNSSIHYYDYDYNLLNRDNSLIGITLGDINSWCGSNTGNLGEYIRWAANSDKWEIQQVSNGCGGGASRSNQALINWKDKRGICPTCAGSGGYDAGDFWVDDPTNNPNHDKYEDHSGRWVQPYVRDIYLIWAVSGANPYQVSISAYPSDADIRYTTDGSEPSQTSSLYAGPLNLVPPASQVMQVKARAFRAGMNPAETESRILAPSSKALPAGYVKEMLCLENAQGTMVVPMADSAGIWARYVGVNKAIPFDGDQVIVNGHTYTWRLRSDADGIWSPATAASSLAFWYTTIIAPSSRMVKLAARFNSMTRIFNNGVQAFYFYGFDSNHEWVFGSGDYTSLGFLKGANGVLVQQHDDGVFGMRFLTLGDSADTDLRYFPYTGVSQAINGQGRPAQTPGVSLWALRGDLNIAIGSAGAHSVCIYDVNGRNIRSFRGTGVASYRIPGKQLGAEMFMVSVKRAAGEFMRRIHLF